MDKYIDCQECNGTGICKRCNGDGAEPYYGYDCIECDLDSRCQVCNGRGTDPRIIRTDIGTVGISKFVARQTAESRFSYYDDSIDILQLIRDYIDTKVSKYRPDILGIIVPPEGFFSSIVEMKEGDKLVGKFVARKEGEDPRTQIGVVGGEKIPAKFVEVILYSREALAEGSENSLDVDWEIISINASPVENENVPLRPMTLVSNHFELSGGTATNMSETEFIVALKESMDFWKNKGLVADV